MILGKTLDFSELQFPSSETYGRKMNPDHEMILLRRLTVYLVLDCFGSQVSFSEAMWVSLR